MGAADLKHKITIVETFSVVLNNMKASLVRPLLI